MLNGWLFIHKKRFKQIGRLDAHGVADDNIQVFDADPHGGRRLKTRKANKEIDIMKNIAKKIIAFAATAALTITSAAALADTLQIGVPDDGTNLSRGIKLLESAGLIEVDPRRATPRRSRTSPSISTTSR